MDIIFDHQIFSSQKYGGISRYFFELGVHINKIDGVSVEVIAPFHHNQYLHEGNLPVRGTYINNKLLSTRVKRKVNRILSPSLIRSSKPDLLHETYFSSTSLFNSDFPIVTTVYDMIHEKFSDLFPSDPTSENKKKTVKRAEKIICISDSTKSDLINILKIPEEKITTIHLGFSFSNINSSKHNIRSIPKPYILYVGQRDHHKNFISLIKAYANLKTLNNEIDIVTFGGGVFTENELALIKEYGINNKAVHHFSGDDNLLEDIYRNAFLFCCPSLSEGFGLPILESMACGCPVICSDTSSLPEVAGDAAVYFDPNNIETIMASIEKVVFDSSFRASLIEKGKKRVKEFTWEKCAEETLKVYNECI